MKRLATIALALALGVAAFGATSPWLGVSPIPMSKLSWEGILGGVPGDETRTYVIAARDWMGWPGLSRGGFEPESTKFIDAWLRAHPDALAIPVEAMPDSRDTAEVYVWVVAGSANLNVELVEKGYCRASVMAPIFRPSERLIGPERVEPFLKQIAEAERRACAAGLGLWKSASKDDRSSVGRIPGWSMVLADLVAGVEKEKPYVPPPVYTDATPEVDLIRIADGADPGASYAALGQLVHRAIGGRLSPEGFASLIATGLERQARADASNWRAFYGSVIDVAYGQGILPSKQVERYVAQSVALAFTAEPPDAKFSAEGESVPVRLIVEQVHRVAGFRNIEGEPKPSLPLNARVILSDVKLDGTPVTIARYGEPAPQVDLGCSVISGGSTASAVRLMPPRPLAPGTHEIAGRVVLEIRKGEAERRIDVPLDAPLSRRTLDFHAPFEVAR